MVLDRHFTLRTRMLRSLTCALAILGFSAGAYAQELYVSEEQQRQLYEAAQQSELPEVQGVTNLYSSVLNFAYPNNWVPVYQARQPGVFMMEYIPFGEDVRTNWTEMLTIQAIAEQRARNIQPAQFSLGFGQRMAQSCSGESSFEDIGEYQIEGASAYRVAFECSGTGSSELTVMQATKRQDDLIVVQFAIRGVPEDGQAFLTSARRDFYISLLDQLRFSDNPAARTN